MSKLSAKVQREQDRVHAHLVALFPEFKLERDKNQESVLWIPEARALLPVVLKLRADSELLFDRLSDITAYDNIDHRDGPKRFIGVYQLYAMASHARLRLKVPVNDGEDIPTLCGVWKAANWLEREVFDMFGIRFKGHPDLRRILMDERFEGHPLRKEYDLKDRQPFPDTLPVRIAERGEVKVEVPVERVKEGPR